MENAENLKGVNVIEPIKIDHPSQSQTTRTKTFNTLEQVGLGQRYYYIPGLGLHVNESPTPSIMSDKSTDEKPQVYVATDDNHRYEVGRSGDHGSTHSYKNVCQGNPDVGLGLGTDGETIALVQYNRKLKAEIQAWSSHRILRKRQFRQASMLPPEVLTMENVTDILTEDDKAFLAEAPDYVRIAKDLKSLVEESVICARMEEKANILTTTLLTKLEEKLNSIKCDIFNYSNK